MQPGLVQFLKVKPVKTSKAAVQGGCDMFIGTCQPFLPSIRCYQRSSVCIIESSAKGPIHFTISPHLTSDSEGHCMEGHYD